VTWPFASLISVVPRAHAVMSAAVEQRVDWPALRRSLAGQIVGAMAAHRRAPRPAPLTVGAVTSSGRLHREAGAPILSRDARWLPQAIIDEAARRHRGD